MAADADNPSSGEEAAGIVRAAHDSGSTLAIFGGGTRDTVGRPVFADGAMSASGLSGITAYRPSELVITAGAGTPLAEIEAALSEHGQRLAFEPADLRDMLGSSGEPQVGSVAASNNSGPRRLVAGAARDGLLGVRFVNGKGQTISNGGRVMKNVTGLDLVKLMAGSWGTLGFLTEVTFKVLPRPETERTLVLYDLDDDRAAQAMAHAMASSAEVSGAAHLPELAAGKLGGKRAMTVLRLEGFADSVRDRYERLDALYDRVAETDAIETEESRRLWRDIRDVRAFAGSRELVWRVSMAPSEAHKFVMAIRMQAAVDAFYDWQGGLVWLAVEDRPHDELIRRELARHGGGHATLYRADSEIRLLVPVFQPLSPAVAALSRRIKAAFDPAGVFNPGRMASPDGQAET